MESTIHCGDEELCGLGARERGQSINGGDAPSSDRDLRRAPVPHDTRAENPVGCEDGKTAAGTTSTAGRVCGELDVDARIRPAPHPIAVQSGRVRENSAMDNGDHRVAARLRCGEPSANGTKEGSCADRPVESVAGVAQFEELGGTGQVPELLEVVCEVIGHGAASISRIEHGGNPCQAGDNARGCAFVRRSGQARRSNT